MTRSPGTLRANKSDILNVLKCRSPRVCLSRFVGGFTTLHRCEQDATGRRRNSPPGSKNQGNDSQNEPEDHEETPKSLRWVAPIVPHPVFGQTVTPQSIRIMFTHRDTTLVRVEVPVWARPFTSASPQTHSHVSYSALTSQFLDRGPGRCWPNPYGFPYDSFMADVVTTGEARDALHQIARRFDNGDGEPVYFGSHRRAQGVIVPVDVWEKLLEQAEDELDLASARQRLAHDDGRRLTGGDLDEAFRGAAEAASREPA